MIRTQIQLTEAQAKKVKKLAMEEGTSIAEVVRKAIENIAEARLQIDSQERIRRATEIAGKYRSGKKDISQKHDEYLAEAYEE
jgi:hypothetical protein